jgi:GNAT superfamily N-acetyltransferase
MALIEMLPAAAADDPHLVVALTELVNRVYAEAEQGFWVEGTERTTTTDVARLIAGGEIAVARDGDGDAPVVGSIRVHALDGHTGALGMLVADPAHRGEGVGRDLMGFAEEHCRRQDHTVMQLELLVARQWTHPTKAFLDTWYARRGYRPVRSRPMAEARPRLAPFLATACDLVVYHKPLA